MATVQHYCSLLADFYGHLTSQSESFLHKTYWPYQHHPQRIWQMKLCSFEWSILNCNKLNNICILKEDLPACKNLISWKHRKWLEATDLIIKATVRSKFSVVAELILSLPCKTAAPVSPREGYPKLHLTTKLNFFFGLRTSIVEISSTLYAEFRYVYKMFLSGRVSKIQRAVFVQNCTLRTNETDRILPLKCRGIWLSPVFGVRYSPLQCLAIVCQNTRHAQESNTSTYNHANRHTHSQDTTGTHPSGKLVNYKRLACYEHCPGTFGYTFLLEIHLPWYRFSVAKMSWWNLSPRSSLTSPRFSGKNPSGLQNVDFQTH